MPRHSHHKEEVSAFVAVFGRTLELATEVDEVGNVLIRRQATAGMEESQGVARWPDPYQRIQLIRHTPPALDRQPQAPVRRFLLITVR
jgi:hypothetical protein